LLNQACQGHIERRRREVERGVLISLIDIIHDAEEADLQTLWPEISTIREQAKNILSLIEPGLTEHGVVGQGLLISFVWFLVHQRPRISKGSDFS